jgi:hypothetical protein
MDEVEPQLLSVARTAELLGIPEHEVRRRIAAKTFPVVMVDQRMMVLAPALQRWVVEHGDLHRQMSADMPEIVPAVPNKELRTAIGQPCPNCGAPLVPAPEYNSARLGGVSRCPHSLVYFAIYRGRPVRVTDLVRSVQVTPDPVG